MQLNSTSVRLLHLIPLGSGMLFWAALLARAAPALAIARQLHSEVSIDPHGLLDKVPPHDSPKAARADDSATIPQVAAPTIDEPVQKRPPRIARSEEPSLVSREKPKQSIATVHANKGNTQQDKLKASDPPDFKGVPHLNFYANAGCTDYATQLKLPKGTDWTSQTCVKVKSHAHHQAEEDDIFLTLECTSGDAKVVMYNPDADPAMDCQKADNLYDSIQIPAQDTKNGLEACQKGLTSGGFDGWVSIREVDSGSTMPPCMVGRSYVTLILYTIGGLVVCALLVGLILVGKRWFDKRKAAARNNAEDPAQNSRATEEEADTDEEEEAVAVPAKAATKGKKGFFGGRS